MLRSAVTIALATVVASGLAARAADMPEDFQFRDAYEISVSDVTAKVGETAVMHATLHIKDGYRILHGYNNRVGMLSAEDNGVAFERKSFPASIDGDTMNFDIALKPTAPGTHPINGVFRVAYIEAGTGFSMVSLKLIAKVTGTP